MILNLHGKSLEAQFLLLKTQVYYIWASNRLIDLFSTLTIETNTNRITIGTTLKPRTIDPADAYEVISGNLLHNLGDRLYGYKLGTMELVPSLATEMPKIKHLVV